MMRIRASGIFIGFILACALVFAQDVQISITAPQPGERQIYTYVQENQPSQSYDLGAQLVFSSLEANVNVYSGSSSSYSLCVRFDQNSATDACSPISQNSNKVSFPVTGKVGRNVQFLLRGFSQTGGGYGIYIQKFEWLGGPGQTLTRSLSSLGGTSPVKLGTVRTFITQQPGQEGVRISSSDARAVAWFNQAGIAAGTYSPTTRNQTQHPDDDVLACLNGDLNLDANKNPKCDYIDEAECASRNRDYFAGSCCGDAPYQSCAFYSDKQALCGQDAQGKFVWAPLASAGVVVPLRTCPRVDVVSDGSKYYSCGQPSSALQNIERFQGKVQIAGHEYVCEGDNVIECGGNSPYSPNAKRAGAVFNISGVPNTCSADGKWKVSFDGDQASCQAAGLGWTGTKCCGEQGDSQLSYEDAGGSGGCFKRQLVRSGDAVSGNRNVINHKGKFYICEPDSASQSSARSLFDATGITPTIGRACGDPLQNTLSSGSAVHAICSPLGMWEFVATTAAHKAKLVPWQPSGAQVKSGCCPAGQCWDGNACRDRGSTALVMGKGYKCQ